MKYNTITVDTETKKLTCGEDNCQRWCQRKEEVKNFVKKVIESGKFTEDGQGAINVEACDLKLSEQCLFEVIEK